MVTRSVQRLWDGGIFGLVDCLVIKVDQIEGRVGSIVRSCGSIDKFFLTLTLSDSHASRHPPSPDPNPAGTLGSADRTLSSDIPFVEGENYL